MRAREAGFTLLEMVVAIGIAVILLAAGGYWMLSMRPGSLRGALDDFDSNLAAAKAIAASSGNGATLVFAPKTGGAPGLMLRVYSGRPNAANAVTSTNTMAAVSATSVRETHFGNPPFAIFLNSAGYPTGSANYPTLDGQGNPTFGAIAQQPPCPSGGIELTFTSPQGVTATRTLPCNTMVATTGIADPTPTPNAPRISPTYLLAHFTTDSGPLTFKAAEYGYYHWYASTQNGPSCQTQSSDTGAAPATFASPWPYAQPSPSNQSGAPPVPPALAPYTWPAGDPNDPPAWFQLAPVLHNGGMCSVTVADDYNQSGSVQVQVMGDLTPSTTSPPQMTVGGGSDTIAFSKTFDSEKLLLSAGGPCLGIVTATTASGSYPSSPSHTPATGTVTVTPVGQGTCNLIVQDQYGEQVTIGANVKAADGPLNTLGQVEFAGGDVAMLTPQERVAKWVNALLGGSVAAAGTTTCSFAQLWLQGGVIDANNADGFNQTDANGCVTNDQVRLWATESNYSGIFNALDTTCRAYETTSPLSWSVGNYATITPSAMTTGCSYPVQSSDRTAANGGAENVNVIVDLGSLTWTSVSFGCTTQDQGNGNYLIRCSGAYSASYNGSSTCAVEAGVDTVNPSGNGGGAGQAIAGGSGAYPISPLPTSASDWAALLDAALGQAIEYGGASPSGSPTPTTSGCPPL